LTHATRNAGAFHNPNAIFITIERYAKPHTRFLNKRPDSTILVRQTIYLQIIEVHEKTIKPVTLDEAG
jgi:hypothetical protein